MGWVDATHAREVVVDGGRRRQQAVVWPRHSHCTPAGRDDISGTNDAAVGWSGNGTGPEPRTAAATRTDGSAHDAHVHWQLQRLRSDAIGDLVVLTEK